MLVLAVLAAVQFASFSSAEAGYTRTAALTAIAGSGRASGAGSLRIDRQHNRLCWQLWTQALPSRKALIGVEPRHTAEPPAFFPTRIVDAQAQGCANLRGERTELLQELIGKSTRYRLLVAVPGSNVIAGTLRGQ